MKSNDHAELAQLGKKLEITEIANRHMKRLHLATYTKTNTVLAHERRRHITSNIEIHDRTTALKIRSFALRYKMLNSCDSGFISDHFHYICLKASFTGVCSQVKNAYRCDWCFGHICNGAYYLRYVQILIVLMLCVIPRYAYAFQ